MTALIDELKQIEQVDGCDDLAERLASRALERVGAFSGPSPLEKLAESFGIQIKYLPMKHDGALVPQSDNGYVAFIDAESCPVRQRFSLAHEIAHAITFDLVPDARTLAKRSLFMPLGAPAEERLCDAIAARLLMPTASVVRRFDGEAFSAATVSRLAMAFSVSRPSAVLRLRECFNCDCGMIRAIGHSKDLLQARISVAIQPVRGRLRSWRNVFATTRPEHVIRSTSVEVVSKWKLRDQNLSRVEILSLRHARPTHDGRSVSWGLIYPKHYVPVLDSLSASSV